MAIQGITFDFWNTLFTDTGGIGKLRHDWRLREMAKGLNKMGWTGGPEALAATVEGAGDLGTQVRLRGGSDFLPEQQLEFIFSQLQVVPPREVYDEVYAAYTGATAKFPPQPLPGSVDTVRRAAELCPVGLISNTGITPGTVLRQVLDGAGILKYFRALTFSNEVNLVKPNHEIFRLTAQKLGASLADVLHVGDDYEADVLGAERAGARGVWLKQGEITEPAQAFAIIHELPQLLNLLGR